MMEQRHFKHLHGNDTYLKKGCEPNCFSTLGYNVAYCYSAPRVIEVVDETSHEPLPRRHRQFLITLEEGGTEPKRERCHRLS